MHSGLSQHLHTDNILVTEQYGIRKEISTEDAAFGLTGSLFTSSNQKMHVGGIFCDLAKLIAWIITFYYLNYISMEFEEYLKIGTVVLN